MTREEAIDIFEDNFTVLNIYSHYTVKEENEAIELAISALKGGWIDDRAPEDRKEVLVYDNAGDMFVAWFEDNEWQSTDELYTNDVPILAWQPLPEPYKKGE